MHVIEFYFIFFISASADMHHIETALLVRMVYVASVVSRNG